MRMQTGRLEIGVSVVGREHRVTMEGQIDERATLSTLAEKVGDKVVIDLEKVSFINSIGVREWIRLLRQLAEKKVQVTLRRCSEAMVYQLNMIIDTSTNAQVDSFYAPYACNSCGYEGSMCLEMGPNLDRLRKMEAPELACPECRSEMQLSEMPQRYLLFVERVVNG